MTNSRPGSTATTLVAFLLLAPVFAIAGCGDDGSTIPREGALFELEVSGESFHARVTNPSAVEDLEERMSAGVEGVVSGTLARGDGGFNASWSWHWTPESVHAPDMAIEVCDGRPSFVEDDLDYWVDTVGQFCPWGATVVERVE